MGIVTSGPSLGYHPLSIELLPASKWEAVHACCAVSRSPVSVTLCVLNSGKSVLKSGG